jgi:hypothetical protein
MHNPPLFNSTKMDQVFSAMSQPEETSKCISSGKALLSKLFLSTKTLLASQNFLHSGPSDGMLDLQAILSLRIFRLASRGTVMPLCHLKQFGLTLTTLRPVLTLRLTPPTTQIFQVTGPLSMPLTKNLFYH